MISCDYFYSTLLSLGIGFFTGVPDSLLKDFCAYVTDHVPPGNHLIAANEGNAIALAAGYHLATNKVAAVYMQNAGQGNAINPLTSLVDQNVYGIPLLLIIGWRGEPGGKDEPQHIKQGKITLSLLDILGIPHEVLSGNPEEVEQSLGKAVSYMQEKNAPYAMVVKKGIFEPYTLQDKEQVHYRLSREEALKLVIKHLSEEDVIISTTGKTSREIFDYREEFKQGHGKDFLTVGSMGHASSIALEIALQKPKRNIYCLDGDGAAIMHMGAFAIIGSQGPKNFRHIIFNNGAHDSVGGQPTVGFKIDFLEIAKACGYKIALKAETESEIAIQLSQLQKNEGPGLLEIRVKKGARKDLGRPTTTPEENKSDFMEFLSK